MGQLTACLVCRDAPIEMIQISKMIVRNRGSALHPFLLIALSNTDNAASTVRTP